MRNLSKTLLGPIACLSSIALGAPFVNAAPRIFIDADTTRAGVQSSREVDVGDVFTVEIVVEGIMNNAPLHAFELDIGFAGSIVRATSVMSGDLLVAPVFTVEARTGTGNARLALTTLGSRGAASGGVLARIGFEALSEGSTPLVLVKARLAAPFGVSLSPVETFLGSVEVRAAASAQKPGDCNQDGRFDISDGICLLNFLFLGTIESLPCGDGAAASAGNVALLDVNGDARIDISDVGGMFGFLFVDGPPPVLGTECVPIADCPSSCNA